jgi:hypothetical protein
MQGCAYRHVSYLCTPKSTGWQGYTKADLNRSGLGDW